MPFTTSLLEGIGDAGRGIGRVASHFGGKNLKYTLGAAAALGIASERPFHGAYENIVNQGIIGVPHATRAIADARLSATLQGVIGAPYMGQSMGLYTSRDDQPEDPNALPGDIPVPPTTASIQGPDGSIVFGLHNLRA